MTDKELIRELVAALRPYADMRKAAKGRMPRVGIASSNPNAVVYAVNPNNRDYSITAGDFDRAIVAIEAAERKVQP